MRGFFDGLRRARRLFASRAGVTLQRRGTSIHSKPPKEDVGAVESIFVLTVMTLATLGPAGWILAHVEHYKNS